MSKLRAAMQKEIQAGQLARQKEAEKIQAAEKERQRLETDRKKTEAEERKKVSQLSAGGIKGAAAKFHYAAADTVDGTKGSLL